MPLGLFLSRIPEVPYFRLPRVVAKYSQWQVRLGARGAGRNSNGW